MLLKKSIDIPYERAIDSVISEKDFIVTDEIKKEADACKYVPCARFVNYNRLPIGYLSAKRWLRISVCVSVGVILGLLLSFIFAVHYGPAYVDKLYQVVVSSLVLALLAIVPPLTIISEIKDGWMRREALQTKSEIKQFNTEIQKLQEAVNDYDSEASSYSVYYAWKNSVVMYVNHVALITHYIGSAVCVIAPIFMPLSLVSILLTACAAFVLILCWYMIKSRHCVWSGQNIIPVGIADFEKMSVDRKLNTIFEYCAMVIKFYIVEPLNLLNECAVISSHTCDKRRSKDIGINLNGQVFTDIERIIPETSEMYRKGYGVIDDYLTRLLSAVSLSTGDIDTNLFHAVMKELKEYSKTVAAATYDLYSTFGTDSISDLYSKEVLTNISYKRLGELRELGVPFGYDVQRAAYNSTVRTLDEVWVKIKHRILDRKYYVESMAASAESRIIQSFGLFIQDYNKAPEHVRRSIRRQFANNSKACYKDSIDDAISDNRPVTRNYSKISPPLNR